MKALVHTAPYTFQLQDVPIPVPQEQEVLVRIKAVGICGSDVHGMTGHTGRRKPPIIMGHEASGVVEKVGAKVARCSVGDRVTFDSTIYCNSCEYCLQGRINLCSNRRVLGVSCDEYRRDGAMAEYVVVPQHIVYPLPPSVSFHQGAMVEPLSISLHAVNRGKIRIGDSVVVVGCGIIGLMAIQCARLAGCGKLFAIDLNESRLQMALKVGADGVINPSKENALEAVLSRTDGKGADVVLEAVGLEKTPDQALSFVRKGGRLVLIGNLVPQVSMGLQSLVTREIDVYGSAASSGEYQTCVDLIGSGRIEVDPYISVVAPLEEGQIWFEKLLAAKEPLYKVILEP
ncbi:MAG: galactitol-1-phosphate 5-dehydrogenase [Spirochaetales bacterium]